MGLEIDRESFEPAEYERFEHRLRRSLEALEVVLARPRFGEGPPSIGAELEIDLVDARGRPLCEAEAILAAAADPRLCLEIDRFNLEINSRPVALAGRPFAALTRDLDEALGAVRRAARSHGGRVAAIGILPTLGPADLGPGAINDRKRYRALAASLRRARNGPFRVHIEGGDALDANVDDVSLEGANTSFQIHLRTTPEAFARTYNAAQLATGVVLAVAGNSPLLFGRRLWEETRIALFRQSVDDRGDVTGDDWRPARVSFGHGWVRRGAAELFAEVIAMHPPLLPVLGDEDPLDVVARGDLPGLAELRLHNGTVWRWNRAIFDDADGGHLRVELRALPAGPTTIDSVANAAFAIGLTLGLARDADALVHRITFGQARRNFYEAARAGLAARLLWPSDVAPSPRPVDARELALDLLPTARAGLIEGGVEEDEIDRLFGVIERRVETGRTGAAWQCAAFDAYARDPDPLGRLVTRYVDASESGEPVHTWPDP